jgi:hypothetical protein
MTEDRRQMTDETNSNQKFLRGGPGVAVFSKSAPPGDEEPPPVLKSWRNLYILVLGNLLFWIILFTLFTWMFK